jgi:hypothetical protein
MTTVPEGSLDDLRHAVRDKITEARHRYEWCRADVNLVLVQLGLPRIGEDWPEPLVVADEDQAKLEFARAVHAASHGIVNRRHSKISEPAVAMNTLLTELGLDTL